LGDSITAADYPGLLQKELENHGIIGEVVNLGKSGYSSGDYLKYLEKSNILGKYTPDFILLQLGTNDIRLDSKNTTKVDYVHNMGKILSKLSRCKNAAGKSSKVILAKILPVRVRHHIIDEKAATRVETEINPAIEELADKFNVQVQNNYKLFYGKSLLADGVHPTKEGYVLLASSWFEALNLAKHSQKKAVKLPLVKNQANTGSLKGRIAFQSNRDGYNRIYIMNADGSGTVKITDSAGDDEFPVWAPDGKKIAFKSDRDGDYEIYIMDPDGKNLVQLTHNKFPDENPRWSPDGSQLIFHSKRDNGWEIYTMLSDGTNQKQLTDTRGKNHHPAWSPSGDIILFTGNRYLGWCVYKSDINGKNILMWK